MQKMVCNFLTCDVIKFQTIFLLSDIIIKFWRTSLAGDVIHVLTRTDTQDDWWEGRLGSSIGIFPANYVVLLN